MLLIEDDVIYLTRGDDAEFEITIQDEDGNAYEMRDGDKLVMQVRALPSEESESVFKVESDSNQITISHDDTSGAQVGMYSADIELQSGGSRRTIWPLLNKRKRSKVNNFENFIIMPEVTQ